VPRNVGQCQNRPLANVGKNRCGQLVLLALLPSAAQARPRTHPRFRTLALLRGLRSVRVDGLVM
jgi:hypothetical protein